MNLDMYTKFVLTVIAFSLLFIALNLSVLEYFLYGLYNEEMKVFLSEVSSRTDEFYLHVNELSTRTDEISSGIESLVEVIERR